MNLNLYRLDCKWPAPDPTHATAIVADENEPQAQRILYPVMQKTDNPRNLPIQQLHGTFVATEPQIVTLINW